MELAALAILGAAGYLLAQKTTPVARKGIPVKEAFTGSTASTGASSELNKQYKSLMGSSLPQVQSGQRNTPPPASQPPNAEQKDVPDVFMNLAGVEEDPVYVDGNSYVSNLSGEKMNSSEFKHNNMQPFFGSRVKQNLNKMESNVGTLDRYTGAGSTMIRKQELEGMFPENSSAPFGNVYGLEESSEFIQSRVSAPRNRGGEKPFESVRVAPGVGEGFSSTGSGGFQQIEVNDLMMKNMKRTDDLRTANNPKTTYNMPVVPGTQFVGKSADSVGEVRKYKPDTFFIDESGERFGAAGQGSHTKEMNRPIQIMPETTRTETSTEYVGTAQGQDYGLNYVVGSYRKPMAHQYGGSGYRNADSTSSPGESVEKNDYGKSSIEIRPNERFYTSDRVMGLNLSPAEAGANTTHFQDESRPTRRNEMNEIQPGNATGYASSAPSLTVWDPNDIARTTVKEGTIVNDRMGIAAPADGPTRLRVYDPADIARPTQKAGISAKSSYTGSAAAAHGRFTSHQSAYNMRLNPNKQQVAKGRKVMGGNIQLYNGDESSSAQTSKKLNNDIINTRIPSVNRSVDLGPNAADLGRVKYRAPPSLDVSMERNTRDIIEMTENNPLVQSLRKNAEHDERLYADREQ